jgi:hypothetical protein
MQITFIYCVFSSGPLTLIDFEDYDSNFICIGLEHRVDMTKSMLKALVPLLPVVGNGGDPNHPLEGGPIPRNTHSLSLCSGQLYNF